ncbi:tyrosine-type recombinase/integrase [Desulfosporosinus metallidurans]|uniref:Site-specific recombinase XerD n=1 Tax=Desulfosporosinus metallidurans TaxID=1888891 RepID=A0A1Q8QFN0_9FIRM|nr:site-specific integrase [Desulfosporosinus metallidurans]OLN26108.1 hypothetical protein DSOL_5112 [Desulfosporosinus metallidurans]
MGRFEVEAFLDTWGVSLNGFPVLQVNKFLMEYDNPNTAKRYAYNLKKYLEYLDRLGKNYTKASERDVKGFLMEITYSGSTVGQITKITQKSYKSVINEFYKFLINELNLEKEILVPQKSRSNQSFYYGQICLYLDSGEMKKVGNKGRSSGRKMWRFKAKRSYRKWYSEKEIEALATNFKSLRDQVIFLISVRLGCRITEVLTMKYEHYDWENKVVFVSESKTFTRHLAVDEDLDILIKKYCLTDRNEIESQVGVCDYLFLNKKGKYKGQPVHYHNFREILKGCAERAGMDAEKVITHAGRSTRAAEIAKMKRLGVPGVTDEYFIQTMGWSSMASAKPYLKMLDIDEMKAISKRISERRIILRRS